MGTIIKRIESEEEFEAVARLRYEIYAEEMGKTPVGTDHSHRRIVDDLDRTSVICAAFDEGNLVATGRISPVQSLALDNPWRAFYDIGRAPVPEEKQVIFSKLMTKRAYRGTMVIPQLLIAAYEHFRAEGAEVMFMHCAPSLVPMYEVLGCRRYRKGSIDPEVGFRLPMMMILGDIEHFACMRSPLLKSARKFPPNAEMASWFESTFPQFSNPASVRMMAEGDVLRLISQHMELEATPIFEGLSDNEMRQLIRASVVIEAAQGDIILRADDVGTEMYVLLEGAIEICRTGELPNQKVVVTMGKGQFFGEGGFLMGSPRSAAVTAIMPTTLLSISAENFHKFREKKPDLAAKLLFNVSRILAQRLYLEF